MDDLYALEGGGSATEWQRKHRRRKQREAAIKARRALKAEAKADLKKRTKKWLTKWKAKAAANKAAGLPPPSRHGRPRDISKPQWKDMTGQRFGRLTVLRIAPVSKNGGQHCRRWWVKCDCGHAEHLVSGTCLRQGIARSCGCLKSEKVRAHFAEKRAEQERILALPMSLQLAELRHRILTRQRIRRADAKLLDMVRMIVILDEVRQGSRRIDRSGKPVLIRPADRRAKSGRNPPRPEPTLH